MHCTPPPAICARHPPFPLNMPLQGELPCSFALTPQPPTPTCPFFTAKPILASLALQKVLYFNRLFSFLAFACLLTALAYKVRGWPGVSLPLKRWLSRPRAVP